MTISMIAAVGRNNEIGKGNDLVFHFKNDMKFFRETTTGGTVISRNEKLEIDGAEVCGSVEAAVELCKNDEKVFIIGGGNIYSQFLELADRLYLTEVDAVCDDADTFFPEFDKSAWKKEVLAEHNENGIDYRHILYTKSC